MPRRSRRFTAIACASLAPCARFIHDDQSPTPTAHEQHELSSGWTWTSDATVFFGYNNQQRKFTDFWAWESQNWFMLSGGRAVAGGRLSLQSILSLEPLTMEALGSPQVFQTGEAYQGAPNIDRQHPHDLLMGLGTMYRIERGRIGYTLEAHLVGPPALGPTPFTHRESARDNPAAPLIHHFTDSTHATPGVLGAGIDGGGGALEASWFRGEEPDDNRLNIDQPRLDSWSVRASWRRGPWRALLGRASAPA